MKKIFLIVCLFASITSFGQLTKSSLYGINARDIKANGAYSSLKLGKLIDSLILSLESQKRAAGYIPVGNASGIAVDVPLSGDGTLSSAGALAVTKINGATFPTLSGNNGKFLTTDGSLLSWGTAVSTFAGLTDGPGSFSGKTLNYSRVNAGETALEYRTPAQVRSDIGAQSTITFGTGVQAALGVNIGSAGAPVLFDGAGGTPSSLTLTNATGLPPTTGISGWPSNSSGVLTNNGSGTLSWGSAGGTTTNALTVDNSSLQLNSGTTFDGSAAKTISVKASGITNSMLAGSIDASTKLTNKVPLANGGTNADLSATGGAGQFLRQSTVGGNISVSTLTRSDITNLYTQVGQVFTEPWTNLTNWSNVGTPSAAVSGGQLHLNGTASTTTNYIRNNSYGTFNLEQATVSWTETVGTIGASTSGIGFALISQANLGSGFKQSMMVNIELSTTSTGAIKWYFGSSGAALAVVQTSPVVLVPVAGDVLNITLTIYPEKYQLTYNINGGRSFSDTFVAYTSPFISSAVTVVHNASNFSFFNVGGGSSHSIGAVTVKSLHNSNTDYLMIGNSILSGYGCTSMYNRMITKLQKRSYSTFEVNARPSNGVLDINVNEIAAYNPKKLILLACSNDVYQSGTTTALANLATMLTSLAGITTANAPSGYSIANGNLVLASEFQRAAGPGGSTTANFNTSLYSTYGAANIIDFNSIGNDGSSTSLPWTSGATNVFGYSYDNTHPNDYANSLAADEVIRFFNLVKKDTYENEDVPLQNINAQNSYNTPLGAGNLTHVLNGVGNSNRYRYFTFAGAATQAAVLTNLRALSYENVVFGQAPATGFELYADNTTTAGSNYTPTKRFQVSWKGNTSLLQGVQTASWAPSLTVTPAAHTGMTAAGEFPNEDFQGATQTWADGTVALQRFARFRAFTVNKTTTSATFTDMHRAFIEKNIAGSGVTFTRNWSLGMDGNLQVQGSAYFGAASTAPTAFVTIAASVTGNSSLNIGEGVDPTSPNTGDLWTKTDHNMYYRTNSVTYTMAKTLTNTATLDFGSTAAGAATDLTITVTGAADGDPVSIGVPNGSTVSDGSFTGWVSSSNTVTIRFTNNNLVSALDPASGTFRATIIKY